MVNIIFNEYYVNRPISIHKHISYPERISVIYLDDKSYRTIVNLNSFYKNQTTIHIKDYYIGMFMFNVFHVTVCWVNILFCWVRRQYRCSLLFIMMNGACTENKNFVVSISKLIDTSESNQPHAFLFELVIFHKHENRMDNVHSEGVSTTRSEYHERNIWIIRLIYALITPAAYLIVC